MASIGLPEVRNSSSKIQLARLSHVYFEHIDTESFSKFAVDFGFQEAWRDENTVLFRGYGKDQYCYVSQASSTGKVGFRGPAFVAQNEREFEKAASIPGATVTDLSPYPGGGKIATVTTPAGFSFHVAFGQQTRSEPSSPPSAQTDNLGPFNGSLAKKRLGQFQRLHTGPALVHKLGHLGYIVGAFETEFAWYAENFNFVPSDNQHLPDNDSVDVISFMHLDLGEEYSDHHSLFLARGKPGEHDHLHHTSYEVEDFDTQLLGHEWLAAQGYRSVWGVGRHILGSQIFDYWRDTSGFTIEHYADGDLVNSRTGSHRSPAGPLAVWGPELPKDFQEDGTVA